MQYRQLHPNEPILHDPRGNDLSRHVRRLEKDLMT